MTVNPNSISVRDTLDLVERLKTSIQQFAAREKSLEQGLSVNQSRLTTQLEEGAEAEDGRLTEALQRIEETYAEKHQALDKFHEARKARITKAYRVSRQKLREVIEAREGQGKYDRQKNQIMFERQKEAAIAAAHASFGDLEGAVPAETPKFKAMEKLALKMFRGAGNFRRTLIRSVKIKGEKLPKVDDPEEAIKTYKDLMAQVSYDLERFEEHRLLRFFAMLPLPVLFVFIVVAHVGVAGLLYNMGMGITPVMIAGGSMLVTSVIAMVLNSVGMKEAEPDARDISEAMGTARRLALGWGTGSEKQLASELSRIKAEHVQNLQTLEENFSAALQDAEEMRNFYPKKIEEQHARLVERSEARYKFRKEALGPAKDTELQDARYQVDMRLRGLSESTEEEQARHTENYQNGWASLVSDWNETLGPIYEQIQVLSGYSQALFPAWSPEFVEGWTAATEFNNVAKIGDLEVDLVEMVGEMPANEQLRLPGVAEFALPLHLAIPDQGSLLIETRELGRENAVAALNNAILRLLATTPPGRISFTVLDPVGLGENFAGVMHLSDYEESVIHSKIWTQTEQIDQRLAELNQHMEKVIQMYLRNEYESITQYNEEAGNIAEKYHYLVVADFPSGFTDQAAQRLLSIASSGGRCGVYTLIHWDERHQLPHEFKREDLRSASVCLTAKRESISVTDRAMRGAKLVPESPPEAELASSFVAKVGQASIDSTRVEVPFEHIAPGDGQFWSLDTTEELKVPIGRTGATKLQYLAIGKGTRQHALIAGKTGSGKSTLFHVMITNLSLWASPDQVEFYLIDFKKGVEFKSYANAQLPHAKVIAIESDREFGLSVLQRVDDELRMRGDMFRALGAQDIAGYKRAGGTETIPRSLLMIDEFQEFFVEDDRISQNAAVLLDRIVRQGRAFGIHVLLGSQTLGGAFTLARTTLGQMVIRVALQCNEADSYLIMDDSNPAARLLSRPGEGIYNDNAGALEGNSPFQVVWLNEDTKDHYLSSVQQMAQQSGKNYGAPVVFEGNAPGNIGENQVLRELLGAEAITKTPVVRAYLGAPNSIKGPTEAAFQRQSGNNLLIVGQRDEAALAIMSVSMISLSAQHPAGSARFIVFDGTAPESQEREYLHNVIASVPHEVTLAHHGDADTAMGALYEDFQQRTNSESGISDAPATFVFIQGLQRYKKLRYEDDYSFSMDDSAAKNPAMQLNDMILEGPAVGIHIIAICDTYNNVNRFLNRKALTEFEMRLLFQMSANDSASLIDTPKASGLGLNRALFYNEQEGYLETFRPYALPDADWVSSAAGNLQRLVV